LEIELRVQRGMTFTIWTFVSSLAFKTPAKKMGFRILPKILLFIHVYSCLAKAYNCF